MVENSLITLLLILNIIIISAYYAYSKFILIEKIYYEKECIDPKSECSREIKRRFDLYAGKELDDFDISGESLNMMKIKILPNPGEQIAKYSFKRDKTAPK